MLSSWCLTLTPTHGVPLQSVLRCLALLDHSDHSKSEEDSDLDEESDASDRRRKKRVPQRRKLHGTSHVLRVPCPKLTYVKKVSVPD
jgi:hypothetical protein